MPWARASRLKSASQRSKLPVLRQFSCAQPVDTPVKRSATALQASAIRRISKCRMVFVRLFVALLFPRGRPAASDILSLVAQGTPYVWFCNRFPPSSAQDLGRKITPVRFLLVFT